MELLRFIWRFIRRQGWLFWLIPLLSFMWPVEILFWPYFLGKVVDIFNHFDAERMLAWPQLKVLLTFGALVWIIMDMGFRLRDYLQARAYPGLEADIRMEMFDHIQHHSPRYFNEHFAGSLANKISDMVNAVPNLLRILTVLVFPAIAIVILSVVIFYAINPTLSLIMASWVTFHTLLCILFTAKCEHYSSIHGEERSVLAGKIVDSFTNNFAVNLFYRFGFEKSRVAYYQKVEKAANLKAQIFPVKMFTVLCAIMAVEIFLLVGSLIYFWLGDKITTGEVVQAFYTTYNLSWVLLLIADRSPLLFQSLGIAKQALTVMQDPMDVVDAPAAAPLSVDRGQIIFENVSFRYGEKQIFENKNVVIAPGEKVGLVGYSGAGKSTFVNLLLRFFPIERGRILIDGQDIATVTLSSLRNNIALIPQDPVLFHRTLEDNIRYGNPGASREEWLEASRMAHCDPFVQQCPKGYQTLVGERGTKLSGGEKQRIAIARAMLLEAPILVLDEATSSLDSVTEGYIQDSLDKLMNRRTTIVIAHRLSTLSKMDRILVFAKGKVIEEGSHSELLKQGGHYAHMWQMQAGGFLPDQPSD